MTDRKNTYTLKPYSNSKVIFNGGIEVGEGQDLLKKTKPSLELPMKLQLELHSIIIQ